MECKEVIEKIDRYYENELNDIEVYGIEKHLERCSSCEEEYEELRQVFNILSDHPIVMPTEDFTSKIMNQIRAKARANKVKPVMMKSWGISFIAAGLLLFVINTFLGYDIGNISNYISKQSFTISNTIVKQIEEMPKLFDNDYRHLKLEGTKKSY